MTFGDDNVKRRIRNVFKNKKLTFWVVVVSIIIVTAVGIGLILKPKTKEIGESDQITDLLAEAINKDIANREPNPEAKLPSNNSNNSNENAGASVGEETAALKALRDFYGQTDEPIVIYEQTPFDNDYMLVLADRMTEAVFYRFDF